MDFSQPRGSTISHAFADVAGSISLLSLYGLSRMSYFKLIHKKGSDPIPPAPDSIRREVVQSASVVRRTPHSNSFRPKSALPSVQDRGRKAKTVQANGSRYEHARRRKYSSQLRLVSDSDSQESTSGSELPIKRNKVVREDRRPKRHGLRSESAFSEGDTNIFPMVHAGDIASLEKLPRYTHAFPQDAGRFKIKLQYPSASQQEMYGCSSFY